MTQRPSTDNSSRGARPGDAEAAAAPTGAASPDARSGDFVLTPVHVPIVEPGANDAPRPPVVARVSDLLVGGEHTTVLFHELVGAERELDDETLLARLRAATGSDGLARLLDEMVARTEAAAREGDAHRVHAFLTTAVHREEESDAHQVRMAIGVALRRLLALPHVRLVATLLPRMPELRDDVCKVLGRAGEEGADAVIEQLVASESTSDRRAYFSMLVRLQAGVPALVHMLGDPRWYVVRNAAELLGEIGAGGAAEALERALGHEDQRVRRAAAIALGRLATPAAGQALRDALRHADPDTRSHAALALAASGWPYAAAALRRALVDEEEGDVQLALVTALGRAGTEDAVDALAELSEPPRGLFRRRGTPLRTAAVNALADADTPRARDVLARLRKDRDRGVREVVERVLKR